MSAITRNSIASKCFQYAKHLFFFFFLQRFHSEDYIKFKAEFERNKTEQIAPIEGVPYKIQLKLPSQRILFNNYFQIISKKSNKLAAKCKICTETKILVGHIERCSNFAAHLRVSCFKKRFHLQQFQIN